MLWKVISATFWALLGFFLGGLIGWIGSWLLHFLMQGIGWQLGELGIIDKIYYPAKNEEIYSSHPPSSIASFFHNGGEGSPVYGLTLGQIIGVLTGGIYGAKKEYYS